MNAAAGTLAQCDHLHVSNLVISASASLVCQWAWQLFDIVQQQGLSSNALQKPVRSYLAGLIATIPGAGQPHEGTNIVFVQHQPRGAVSPGWATSPRWSSLLHSIQLSAPSHKLVHLIKLQKLVLRDTSSVSHSDGAVQLHAMQGFHFPHPPLPISVATWSQVGE